MERLEAGYCYGPVKEGVMNNILTANLSAGYFRQGGAIGSAYQYDYGRVIQFSGITLPDAFEVHFSNEARADQASTTLGEEYAVRIPDIYFRSGRDIYGWLFLHPTEESGETVYAFKINIIKRPEPNPEEPTPIQQDFITQTIAALQSGVSTARECAESAGEHESAAERYAQSAQEYAENAGTSAENAASAEESAGIHARNAGISAEEAASSALAAALSASQALEHEAAAAEHADRSEQEADRAEQAAHEAGYLDIDINASGHLIYTRTDAVDVDFTIDDGHLVMEAI